MDHKVALTQILHEIVQFQHKLNEIEASPDTQVGGFKPVIPLNSYFSSITLKFIEIPVHSSAGVFMIKTVLDALDKCASSANDMTGANAANRHVMECISEATLNDALHAICKELSVKVTDKGGIVGLNMSISTICSVLHALGALLPQQSFSEEIPSVLEPSTSSSTKTNENESAVALPSVVDTGVSSTRTGADVGDEVTKLSTEVPNSVVNSAQLSPNSKSSAAVPPTSPAISSTGADAEPMLMPTSPVLLSDINQKSPYRIPPLPGSSSNGPTTVTNTTNKEIVAAPTASQPLLSSLASSAQGGEVKTENFVASHEPKSTIPVACNTNTNIAAAPLVPPSNNGNSVIVKAFTNRWNESISRYVKVLKDISSKKALLEAEEKKAAGESKNVSNTASGLNEDSAVKPDAVSVNRDAAPNAAGKSDTSLVPLTPAEIQQQSFDRRVWALASNRSDKSTVVEIPASSSISASESLLSGKTTAPGVIITPISLFISPKATFQHVGRLIYAEQALEEVEEMLLRKILGQCDIDINGPMEVEEEPIANATGNQLVKAEKIEVSGVVADIANAQFKPSDAEASAEGIESKMSNESSSEGESIRSVPIFLRRGSRYLLADNKYSSPQYYKDSYAQKMKAIAASKMAAAAADSSLKEPSEPPLKKMTKKAMKAALAKEKAAAAEALKAEKENERKERADDSNASISKATGDCVTTPVTVVAAPTAPVVREIDDSFDTSTLLLKSGKLSRKKLKHLLASGGKLPRNLPGISSAARGSSASSTSRYNSLNKLLMKSGLTLSDLIAPAEPCSSISTSSITSKGSDDGNESESNASTSTQAKSVEGQDATDDKGLSISVENIRKSEKYEKTEKGHIRDKDGTPKSSKRDQPFSPVSKNKIAIPATPPCVYSGSMSQSIPQLYQKQSLRSGFAFTAQNLIEKAIKLRKHSESQHQMGAWESIESLQSKYEIAQSACFNYASSPNFFSSHNKKHVVIPTGDGLISMATASNQNSPVRGRTSSSSSTSSNDGTGDEGNMSGTATTMQALGISTSATAMKGSKKYRSNAVLPITILSDAALAAAAANSNNSYAAATAVLNAALSNAPHAPFLSVSNSKKRKGHHLAPAPMNRSTIGAVVPHSFIGISQEDSLYASTVGTNPTLPLSSLGGSVLIGSGSDSNISGTAGKHAKKNKTGLAALHTNTSSTALEQAISNSDLQVLHESANATVTGADTILKPPLIMHPDDLVIRTSEIPWPLINREFVELDPEYNEELGDLSTMRKSSAVEKGKANSLISGEKKKSKNDKKRKLSGSDGNIVEDEDVVDIEASDTSEFLYSNYNSSADVNLIRSAAVAASLKEKNSSAKSSGTDTSKNLKPHGVIVLAPNFRSIVPAAYAKPQQMYIDAVANGTIPVTVSDATSNARLQSGTKSEPQSTLNAKVDVDSEEEDIAEETMLRKHEEVLAGMRAKWAHLRGDEPMRSGGNMQLSTGSGTGSCTGGGPRKHINNLKKAARPSPKATVTGIDTISSSSSGESESKRMRTASPSSAPTPILSTVQDSNQLGLVVPVKRRGRPPKISHSHV